MDNTGDQDEPETYTLEELAEVLSAKLILRNDGDDKTLLSMRVTGIAGLSTAQKDQLSFLSHQKYLTELKSTKAAVVILKNDSIADCPVSCLVHDNPYLAYAQISEYFDNRPKGKRQVHPSAAVSLSAIIGEGASIGPGAVIMDNVVLGKNVVVGANTVIEGNVCVGDNSAFRANVTIYHNVIIGDNVCIHSGTAIGSDGFGYAPKPDNEGGHSWQKIYQLGSVHIGNRVEIGSNTSIDRGALDHTVIEDDVIIDNLVHIAHNVHIGKGTAVAGCVGIAGSTTIGRHCQIAGAVGITGHITIADGVNILGLTMVNRSVTKAGTYASAPGIQEVKSWRKNAVRFTQLEKLNQRVKALEKLIEKD